MFGLRTSRFYENRNNNNKIALNLFQGDINDYNENDEYEDMLTKRGKVKDKNKIEYFKNYINNFKETKFKTARPIEIFRKKEEKKQKEIKGENINIIKENIQNNQDINDNSNKFNLIKEKFQEERQNQIVNINNNNIIKKKNENNNQKSNKVKKTMQEINDKIIKNNEVILNKIKKNKNVTKIMEKEKEKIKKKIMKLKEKEQPKNLSTGKALELLDKDNEKFLKLIKAKKMRKTIKKQLNKSFNNSYNIKKFFNELVEIKEFSPIIKTDTNENAKRQIKYIRNKLHMKIICSNDKYINNKLEKEIFNKKRHNSNKIAKYLSKSCSNKSKNNIENNNKEITKICKNQKQNIKKKLNSNQISDIQNN